MRHQKCHMELNVELTEVQDESEAFLHSDKSCPLPGREEVS